VSSRAPALVVEIVRTATLSPTQADELWQLTETFYDTDRDYALARLHEHHQTALVRSRAGGGLLGTASINVHHTEFQGRVVTAIHMSHVLLQPEVRGRNLIQKIGFRMFLAERLRHPLRPIWWFFDTFSYKSYLLLPRNFRAYWPRLDRLTPPSEHALMHQLAARIYGPDWRPAQGIVASSGRKRLRAGVAPLEPGPIDSPDLAFFSRADPGHADGDMLVCLCPLSALNWLSAGLLAARRLLCRAKARQR
jgi:hypothetical protein